MKIIEFFRKLFRKLFKKDNELTWMDITYRMFKKIQEANEITDAEEKVYAVVQAVYGEQALDLDMRKFVELAKTLKFMNTDIPNDYPLKNHVIVNDREYYFDGMLGEVTTAQYLDFSNYSKAKDELKSFSVFFIPVGHKYNDGYDMLQVFDDLMDFPIPVIISASFFFKRQQELFIKIFQHYSIQKIKKLKLPKRMKEQMIKIARISNSLAQFRMY